MIVQKYQNIKLIPKRFKTTNPNIITELMKPRNATTENLPMFPGQ